MAQSFRHLVALTALLLITSAYYIYIILFIQACKLPGRFQSAGGIENPNWKYVTVKIKQGPDGRDPGTPRVVILKRRRTTDNKTAASLSNWNKLKVDVRKAIGNNTPVLLLAYQRTGSTLTGAFFNNHPDIFYVYEPLDSAYVATYGIQPGWSVPSDIYTLPSGKERIPPQHELDAMRWTMERIWSCDFASLSLSALMHPFWFRFVHHVTDFEPYIRCLSGGGMNISSLPICTKDNIEKTCGWRFNPTFPNQAEYCRNKLAESFYHDHVTARDSTLNFDSYFACLESYRETVARCLPLLINTCRKRSVRFIKSVRVPMSLMADFLEQQPRFKLIHLLRDPLGVVLSRHANVWSRGFYDLGDVDFYGRSALTYCRRAYRDIVDRRHLERLFPGRILTLVFDHFAEDPESTMKKAFSFLGADMPPFNQTVLRVSEEMLQEKLDVQRFGANLKNTSTKWQAALPSYVVSQVKDRCKQFYDEVEFDWNY